MFCNWERASDRVRVSSDDINEIHMNATNNWPPLNDYGYRGQSGWKIAPWGEVLYTRTMMLILEDKRK